MDTATAEPASAWLAWVRAAPAALLQCEYEARTPIRTLGFAGSKLNGALGEGLRRLAAEPGDPRVQSLAREALHAHLFPEELGAGLRERPLALGVPGAPLDLQAGDGFSLAMVLLGRAARQWRAWLSATTALRLATYRGEGELRRLSARLVTPAGPAEATDDLPDEAGSVSLGYLTAPGLRPAEAPVRVELLTPTVLLARQRLLLRLGTAEPLFRFAVRSLSCVAGRQPEREAYLAWKAQAEEVPVLGYELGETSPVRHNSQSIKAIAGHVDLAPLPPALADIFSLAQFTHLGQQPGLGLGRFAVIPLR